ncbi:MAG: hypothetical protein ACREV4_10765 [Gammaproteobacteria bacterium]
MADESIRTALANLHDAFLNASVVRRLMLVSPIEADPERAHYSDRFRLERLWLALLAVLIEAWHAKQMRGAREFLSSVTNTDDLVSLIRQARKAPHRRALFQTRHYMFHRDEREYWNEGRYALYGTLEFNLRLHEAFSAVLLAGLAAIKNQQNADRRGTSSAPAE